MLVMARMPTGGQARTYNRYMTEQQSPVVEPPPDMRRTFLQAVVKLCQEREYREISLADVAALAGQPEERLVEIWPAKNLLFLEALLAEVAPRLVFPDTGDFASDLRAQLTAITEAFADPGVGPHIAALAAEARSDRVLAEVFLEKVFSPNRAVATARLRSARECGQVRGDCDMDAAVDMVFGPIWFRLLLGTGPLTPGLAAALADQAVTGLAPRGEAR
jgi:hypothetical protein